MNFRRYLTTIFTDEYLMNLKTLSQIVLKVFTVFFVGIPVAALSQETLTLETLPTGQYYYQPVGSDRQTDYIFLAKAGHSVIGFDRRSRTQPSCFRGTIEGDRILEARQIFPPYRPDSRWNSIHGEFLDLSQYQRVEHTPTPEEISQLQTCLAFFSH